MTPLEINMILELHCSCAVPRCSVEPMYRSTLQKLRGQGLIRKAPELVSGWTTTDLGSAYVQMLEATPLPEGASA